MGIKQYNAATLMEYPFSEWVWKMEYCRKCGIPPAQKWAWDTAEKAYKEHLKGVEKK